MNTQTIIDQATFDAYNLVPVDARTPGMKEQIEAYEAANSLNVDAEEHAPVETPTATVVEADTKQAVVIGAPEAQPQPSEAWSIDTVTVDQNIAEQFAEAYAIVENQLPAFKEEKHKMLFVLAAKATCLTKWTGPFTYPIRSTNDDLNHRLAQTFGLLSFDYFKSKSLLNKAMKEAQIATKYLTTCVVPEEVQRDTDVKGYSDVKKGCMFIAHSNPLKRDENNRTILGQFENIFQDEEVKNDAYHTGTTAIMGVRYKQQIWLESNKAVIENLIEKLQLVRPAQVKAETFKAWSGILALALLWDKAIFDEMLALMVEKVGTEPLESKYKLACALSIVVPDMESFLNRYGNNADMKLSNTIIGRLLKSVGFTEDLSDCFADLGLPLKDHKSGYTVQLLKDTYTPLLAVEDVRIPKYLNGLKRPDAANTPEQKVA